MFPKPTKKKRLPSLESLSKKLWRLVSEYVRRKDADEYGYVKCFTCGKADYWQNLDAGHYIPKSVSLYLRFDERNLKPQDTACNRFRHGNLTQYALALEKLYGPGILEELDSVRHTPTKYNRGDYESMIETYTKKLAALND